MENAFEVDKDKNHMPNVHANHEGIDSDKDHMPHMGKHDAHNIVIGIKDGEIWIMDLNGATMSKVG